MGAHEAHAQGCQPPFAGTIFINPNIITPDDPNAFSEIVYAGRAARQMFDRGVDGWITVQPFLFNAFFDDGFEVEVQVNPEFGNSESAMTQAERYARAIGQLPAVLRRDVTNQRRTWTAITWKGVLEQQGLADAEIQPANRNQRHESITVSRRTRHSI